ncbi:MAG: alpha/beta hydrolase, partial [Dehalococcoidia bacterium]
MKRALVVAAPLAAGGVALAARRRGRAPVIQPSGEIRVIDGERMHIVDRGDGPAIVLIHGFLGNTASWRFVIDDLSRDRRVVALDHPGFGFSERDPGADLSHEAHARRTAGVMDQLGIDRATIVGHSMGGGIAQRFAIQFPDRTGRLVLLCAVNAGVRPDWGRRGRGAKPFMAGMRVLARWPSLTNRLTLRTMREIVADPDRLTAEDAWLYTAPLLQRGTVACIESMLRSVREEEPADLSRITAPTLVLSGECDTAVPPAVGATIAAAIPGARTHVWPG